MFSSNASQVSDSATYIEDVFSTWLTTGTGVSNTQTITNGIDLAGEGGLVWSKRRNGVGNHILVDTVRGVNTTLSTDNTDAQVASFPTISSFLSSGFTATNYVNSLSDTFAFWTFRKQPKFFDVVTWVGNGSYPRNIAHNLGSVPGCIIVKNVTSSPTNWLVYHKDMGSAQVAYLNLTNGFATSTSVWNATSPTSTQFTVGSSLGNANGATYVAYLFAHDAGGFGLTGTDNVISCGSYTAVNGTSLNVNLGFEPQWLLVKKTNSTGDWWLQDNMRGFTAVSVLDGSVYLKANSSAAESIKSTTNDALILTSTGFTVPATSGDFNSNGSYIYIAIRRGPMKTPTSGTSVFALSNDTTGVTAKSINAGFPTDMVMQAVTAGGSNYTMTRLTGSKYLTTQSTAAESALTSPFYVKFDQQNTLSTYISDQNNVFWNFQRAPGFMDVCCYTGTGANADISHNLGAIPELMIVKCRSNISSPAWVVYSASVGNTKYLVLNTTAIPATNSAIWNNTTPTSTTFRVGTDSSINGSGRTNVAYLFASCPGVSKVGSYTGDGTTGRVINCGFTSGARFVLIKATNQADDWYVWDSARGIVAGNDPYLKINSTSAEVTIYDAVDADASGFVINQLGAVPINSTGINYIYLAIA